MNPASSMELREYSPQDFDRLWQLDQRCFSADIAYSRRELGYYLKNKNAVCLVAWNREEIAGFILGHAGARGFGHIVTLDVEAGTRKSGLGSSLIAALEDRFRRLDLTSAFLEVAVDNHAALSFYKKHGYTILKSLRRYYPGGLDGLLMGKQL